ncbi:MAG TPA: metallophosphoesterase [Gemmataceae bacterium]|jgi:3',5'-cyclic AMP phosphodiesterase CpdA|nr:metallophosphoesterase [Gemmataceae bacterium]
MVRLCHISDIHITNHPLGWQAEDWFNKRLAAWANLRVLGRAHYFRLAETVMTSLMNELGAMPPDRVVFSGDATALGFGAEIERAAKVLGLTSARPLPGLAVPGNHDYCTIPAARSGDFERHFAPWQQGERVGNEVYPFAQQVGPVWLVAVNGATGNRWAWDAGGRVDTVQLERLQKLLARLQGGPRILVIHFPVCTAAGKLERADRRLRDLKELIDVCSHGGISLWLHGHRHRFYHLAPPPQAPFPVICAGSTTQENLWSHGNYVIEDRRLRAAKRAYDPLSGTFTTVDEFELALDR